MKAKLFNAEEAFARQAKGENCVVWYGELFTLIHVYQDSAWVISESKQHHVPIISALSLTIPTIKRERWVAIGKWNGAGHVVANSGDTKEDAESYWKLPNRTLIASHKFEWEEEA